MTATIISVPLKDLVPGTKAGINSRKTSVPIDGLAKSIAEHGLIMPLLVTRNGAGVYHVVDGNRRLAALNALEKKQSKDDIHFKDIPCIVRQENGNALEVSMVVNVDREDLHPVDRFEVFAALVEVGDTIDAIAKRYGMKIAEVRQALALGKLAPVVREAWRAGDISAEVAEALALTSDHKAQVAAMRKAGKHGGAYQIRRLLMGGRDDNIGALLKFVGAEAYEAAGHQVNASLFQDEDDERRYTTVSDLPALRRMADEKIDARCAALVAAGWRWAIPKAKAPNDIYAWRRERGQLTKEQIAACGVVVDVNYNGVLEEERGYVKPGDKVSVPKSPKQKKADAKKREERKEETGGISNALAMRLSEQLTAALQEALPAVKSAEAALSLAIAVLAAANNTTPHVRLSAESFGNDSDGRSENDFAKYFKLACSKNPRERILLLMTWLAKAVDVRCHNGADLLAVLHPGKHGDHAAALMAKAIEPKTLLEAARRHFDAKDYFSSVSKEMIWQAVDEALGGEHAVKVAKMKAGAAKDYAIKHVPKTGWLPPFFKIS